MPAMNLKMVQSQIERAGRFCIAKDRCWKAILNYSCRTQQWKNNDRTIAIKNLKVFQKYLRTAL